MNKSRWIEAIEFKHVCNIPLAPVLCMHATSSFTRPSPEGWLQHCS